MHGPIHVFATGPNFVAEISTEDIFVAVSNCLFKNFKSPLYPKIFNLINSSFSGYCFYYNPMINHFKVLKPNSALLLSIAEGLGDVHKASGAFFWAPEDRENCENDCIGYSSQQV